VSTYTITLTAYRGYQDIGTVGQTTNQLAGNIQSINQILDVACRNTADIKHSFVRVEELVGLGLALLVNGNQLTSAGAGGSGGGSSYTFADSLVDTSGTVTLVNDTATPGDSQYYGTNSSGTLGYYNLPTGNTYTASESITLTSLNFTLTGDTATPGDNYFYGTNGSGTRGWYAQTYPTALTFSDSVVNSSGTVTLSGDSATPGDSYFYGTNASGTKGWYAQTYPSALTFADSVVDSGGTITLSGDSASPGDSYYYGTNASGTKGWYAQTTITPSLIGVNFVESAGWNSTSGAVQLSLTVPIDLLIPYTCTLKEVYILTQGGSGSCTVDIWKTPIGSYPPTSANDITGGIPPAISSGTVYTNSTLTGWTTSFSQNDCLRLTLAANSTFTSVKLVLRMQ
jgi:hypothetical protein